MKVNQWMMRGVLATLAMGLMVPALAGGLTGKEKKALNAAIDDEYRSRATYAQVLKDFGEVLPFAHIINAENMHVAALTALYEANELEVPADTWAENAPKFATIEAAWQGGAEGEKANVALYDKLMADVEQPEVLAVFSALQAASRDRHLRAFQSHVETGACPKEGQGQGNCQGQCKGQGQGACQGACKGAGQGMGQCKGKCQGQGQANGQGACKGQACKLQAAGQGMGKGMGMMHGRQQAEAGAACPMGQDAKPMGGGKMMRHGQGGPDADAMPGKGMMGRGRGMGAGRV